MPREIRNHRLVLDAIRRTDIISDLVSKAGDHYKYELDLEVMVYGRNYSGKRVGPYLRLLTYDEGEEVFCEGDWGNTFYILVDGRLDVFVGGEEGQRWKVGEIRPGSSFGEMSILTGIQRNATVVVSQRASATVLEVSRPALRLLRKLSVFRRLLEENYRSNSLSRAFTEIQQASGSPLVGENLKRLIQAAKLVVCGKDHVLIRQGEPIDRVILIARGWLKRVRALGVAPDYPANQSAWNQRVPLNFLLEWDHHVDFLGGGHWIGLEGVPGDACWDYTATVMQPTEVLEIPLSHLRNDPELRGALRQSLHRLALAYDEFSPASSAADRLALQAVESEITTGVVEATNLLVMDMDLCVRCGNCSLACHKVHGHSRLMRRGFVIERPVSLSSSSGQRVLSPEVCMHCQDPECLTGCPTGAIARFAQGQVDIDPKTCIGCGDCATQCPYNAITMVPRRASAPEPRSLARRIGALFDLRGRKLPPPVVDVDNLVAVTCNLCHNTPLNPPGAKTQAYSCQENCPTGALVRVNPREYFSEAKNAIGLVYKDQTHAIGRDIHKRDPPAVLMRAAGILGIIAATWAALWAVRRYTLDASLGGTWLTVRWITGLVGLGGVSFALTYTLRKQIYRRRAGPLRYWMIMHVYAGIAAGIILLLHAGSSPRGALTSLLTVSLYLVFLTGLFGSSCYVVCPRLLTDLEAEPLLLEDLRARRRELRETLRLIDTSDDELRWLVHQKVRKRFFSLRYLLRQYLRRRSLTELLAEGRAEFREAAERLSDPRDRRSLMEAVEAAVTLRRVDALIYLHQLLKLWLVPHVVSSAATLMLMTIHVVTVVLFYWR